MSFVYDGSSLPTGKVDKADLPGDENPNEHIQAAEWETVMQAITDLRDALLGAQFIGFSAQADDPNPDGVAAYLWFDDEGNLTFKVDKAVSKGTFKAKAGGVESVVTLVDGTNIATDASLSNVFEVTLAGDRTLDNPTNLSPGFTYIWIIRQDGIGGHSLTFDTGFKFSPDVTSEVASAANAVTVVSAICDPDGSTLHCGIVKY